MMVEDWTFGKIIIDGEDYNHDVIIFKNEVKSWWRIEGHQVAVEDTKEMVKEKPQYIVFGKGASGLMRVCKETKEFLSQRNIKVIAANTAQAVKKFNELVLQDKAVIGAFHLTC